jgi:peroxiredoxin
MRNRVMVLAASGLLLASLSAWAQEAAKQAPGDTPQPLAIGSTAPMADVKMTGVDGKQVSIAGVRGAKGTLVVFTCNHCPWAKAWETRIVELGNTYAKRGMGVIAVNSNDPAAYPEDAYETMQERAKQRGMAFPYVVDATSDLARAFGATRTPEAFLFDRKGKLVYHGAIDDNAKEPKKVTARWLHDALESTLAGKTVAVRESKALGCGIKFRARATSS